MKICPKLLIFELSDCTLRIFRGYDFSIFLILLFLDRLGFLIQTFEPAPPPPRGVSVSNFIDSKLDLLLWLRQIIIFENNFVASQFLSYPPEGNQCFVLTVALYCVEFSQL